MTVQRIAAWRADLVKEPDGAGSAFTLPAHAHDSHKGPFKVTYSDYQDGFETFDCPTKAADFVKMKEDVREVYSADLHNNIILQQRKVSKVEVNLP